MLPIRQFINGIECCVGCRTVDLSPCRVVAVVAYANHEAAVAAPTSKISQNVIRLGREGVNWGKIEKTIEKVEA